MTETWMTYSEIDERFGIAAEAARQLVRRRRWRTQPGNDGKTRALVSDSDNVPPRPKSRGRSLVRPPEHPSEIEALKELVQTLRDQVTKTETAAERDRLRLEAERDRLIAERERIESDLCREREERMKTCSDLRDARAELDYLAAAHAAELTRLEQIIDRLTAPWWRRIWR